MREVDPEAVERANTFFPYAQFEGEKRSTTSDEKPADGADQLADSTVVESPEEFSIEKPPVPAEIQNRSNSRSPWFYVVPILIALGLICGSLLGKRRQAAEVASGTR